MPTAVLYRLLQVIVIAWSTYFTITTNQWAYSEKPEGEGSIWVDSTPAYQAAINNQADYSALPYCRRARAAENSAGLASCTCNHTTLDECILPTPHTTCAYCSSADYTWGGYLTWVYNQPECRAMPLYKIVHTLDGAVSIITQFQEWVEAGWPCSQTDTTPETTCDSNLFNPSDPLFNASQPTLTTRASGQCVCTSPCAPHPPKFLPSCAAAHTRIPTPPLRRHLHVDHAERASCVATAAGRRPSFRWA